MDGEYTAKITAVTIFLIAGTISTFGNTTHIQLTNSWEANTLMREEYIVNFSIRTCNHSLCSSGRVFVLYSIIQIRKRTSYHSNQAKNHINSIIFSYLHSPMPALQYFNTWASILYQAPLI